MRFRSDGSRLRPRLSARPRQLPQSRTVNIHSLSATAALADNSNLTAALSLTAAGLPVFPAGPDKRPLLAGWQEKATTEEEQIRKWCDAYSPALPAIVVGRAGLVVIDCDRHPGGNDGIKAFNRLLSANGGNLADVPITKTANGGAHLFFKQPKGEPLGNGRGQLPDGIDVRGIGGFVIAPGAVLPDGKRWQIVNGRPLLADAFEAGTIPDCRSGWRTSSAQAGNQTDAGSTSTHPTLPTCRRRIAACAARLMPQQRSKARRPNSVPPRAASVMPRSMLWPSVLEE